MIYRRGVTLILALSCFFDAMLQAQDSVTFRTMTRFNFYSNEKKGEIIIHVPELLRWSGIDLSVSSGGIALINNHLIPGKEAVVIGFEICDTMKTGIINTEIKDKKGNQYKSGCEFIRLRHKSNEVKIDRLTGGLIVNQRQFFPFGFYCYSPVQSTLAEEEVVRGFNMISPYQKILPSALAMRKAYMDRCASLGLKVHYNLLSVSGGGGVGSKIDSLTPEQKREYMVQEIKTFMDHPALLAWYISDEPTGNNISPAEIEELYRLVKDIDPWHPVSVVFMAPFLSSARYSNGTDIIMADPYPVPDKKVSMVGDVTESLAKEYRFNKPVWIVPQVFGGGELWSREPTLQEVRSMTWQAIVKGATGIQYFIKMGLNSFPKSTATWSECGRIALEVSYLTPWLLSDEVYPDVKSDSKNILVTSRIHNGQLVILAVNCVNEPARFQITLGRYYNGIANAIFENREVRINGGIITDYIGSLGTMAYKIALGKPKEKVVVWKDNLITDSGFEYVTSPSVPTSCYVSSGGARGATFFLDSREHVEGNFSIRLQTPEQGKSISIKLFPVTVNTGSSYLVSVWAKCDPEQKFSLNPSSMPQYAEVLLGDSDTARFIPGPEWREYVGIMNVPADSVAKRKTNIILRMPGQGVGWFDMIQLIEDPLGRGNKR